MVISQLAVLGSRSLAYRRFYASLAKNRQVDNMLGAARTWVCLQLQLPMLKIMRIIRKWQVPYQDPRIVSLPRTWAVGLWLHSVRAHRIRAVELTLMHWISRLTVARHKVSEGRPQVSRPRIQPTLSITIIAQSLINSSEAVSNTINRLPQVQ